MPLFGSPSVLSATSIQNVYCCWRRAPCERERERRERQGGMDTSRGADAEGQPSPCPPPAIPAAAAAAGAAMVCHFCCFPYIDGKHNSRRRRTAIICDKPSAPQPLCEQSHVSIQICDVKLPRQISRNIIILVDVVFLEIRLTPYTNSLCSKKFDAKNSVQI